MDVPRLELSSLDAGALLNEQDLLSRLGRRIADGLQTYPHFLVIRGIPASEDPGLTVQIARTIADFAPTKSGIKAEERAEVSFTRVEINSEEAGRKSAGTRYSHTNQPLELHTDSSYQAEPHELVAFQMVRSDHEGGDTLIAAVEDVVRELNENVLSTLAEPIFPFGCGAHPVISKRAGTPHIRYYRRQINKALGEGALPTVAALAAMEVLDAVLHRYTILHQFKLEARETLFIHNKKALHGRTGFAAQSDRLVSRVRMHAGCLG